MAEGILGFLSAVGPRYITQYPVCPGPPGFPPSLVSPPVGVFSHQRPAVIHEICGPVAVARPPTPPVAPADKPQFKVYVGKIAPTVDNDFILSLLQVCGPVKSWKPATNPVDGTPTGFGFCEFESAEGNLRARRLLTKLSVDGQDLVVNINQATREYLEKYGEKNTAEEKAKEAEAEARDGMVSLADNENDSTRAIPNVTAREAGDGGQMSTQGKTKRYWNVTEEDSDADKDAMQKIRSMIEERMKSKLPGSPTPPVQPSAGIVYENGDDDTRKRRQRSSALQERKSRRLCEKEDHLGERKAMGLQGWKDRGVAEAGKPSLQIDAASSMHVPVERESTVEDERKSQHSERDGFHKSNDEEKGIVFVPGLVSDKQNSSAPGEKVGFELQAVRGNSSTGPPNVVATVEFARRISVSNPREEVSEETDRSGRKSDESWASERDTERNDKYGARVVNERRKDIHDQENHRQSTSKAEDKKTLDAKQLLANVPKMKEELFAYDVNWAIYDKHGLHERMRPWISKKATEIFGVELAEFVDYVVRSTKERVEAPRMVELLASLLDDYAEMFVLSMWRKLIFEIRKVETGLA